MDRAVFEGRPQLGSIVAAVRARVSTGGRAPLAIAVVLITLLDWPVLDLRPPYGGADPSWQMVVHLWAKSLPGLGPHIVFPYGPLGFLTVPTLWWSSTGVVAWLATIITVAACALVAITRVQRWLPFWAAALVALVVVRGLILLDGSVAAWPLFAWLWAVDAQPAEGRQRLLATVTLAAVADVLLMVKFGEGLIVAGVGVGAPLLWARRPWRELIAAALTLTAGSFALWSALTLAPARFGHYLSSSLALAGGYWAMAVRGQLVYLVLALLMALVLIGVVATTDRRRRSVWLALLTAWVLWLELRHAFTRADYSHIPAAFVALSVLALGAGVGRGRRTQLLRGTVAVSAVVVALVAAGPMRDGYTDRSGPKRLVAQARSLATSSGRNGVEADARTSVRAGYAVPDPVVAAIGSGTVQVDPIDAEAAWAYGLHLRPVPIFQLYSAYTTGLDAENARALNGARAPMFVLRRAMVAVSGHFGPWESPSYQVALVCRYQQVFNDGQWQLLRRLPATRCGPRHEIGTYPLGQPVPVPPSSSGQLVVATFDVKPSPIERLQRLVFREVPADVEIDGQRYPFIAGAASAMHLIDVPSLAAGASPSTSPELTMDTFRVFGSPAHGTVTFWSIPFGAA